MGRKLFSYSSINEQKIGLLVQYLKDIKDNLDPNLIFVTDLEDNLKKSKKERAVRFMFTDEAQKKLRNLEEFHKNITVMMEILSDVEVSVQRGIIKGTVIPE